MLVRTDYKDRNKSIYKCDMCAKQLQKRYESRVNSWIK